MGQSNQEAKNKEGSSAQVGSQAASDLLPQEGSDPIPTTRPSQAEGDRETIEEDLAEKEAQGEL